MTTHLLSAVSVAALIAITACVAPERTEEESSANINVCADPTHEGACDYLGFDGLQSAVDAAPPGAVISMQSGSYAPGSYRDVPFQDLAVRGALVIDGKDLTLRASPGVVLQGRKEFPVSAIVVRDSDVTISGLTISDFFYGEPEDDIYDGHGIFTIDSQVSLQGVRISGIEKMAVTGREAGHVSASELIIENSHLGIWLEETAHIQMKNSRIVGSESAGVAAYGDATATVVDSVIDGNQDDGLYTENRAQIVTMRSDILNNSPFGARAADESTIVICESNMAGNEDDTGVEGEGSVLINAVEECRV